VDTKPIRRSRNDPFGRIFGAFVHQRVNRWRPSRRRSVPIGLERHGVVYFERGYWRRANVGTRIDSLGFDGVERALGGERSEVPRTSILRIFRSEGWGEGGDKRAFAIVRFAGDTPNRYVERDFRTHAGRCSERLSFGGDRGRGWYRRNPIPIARVQGSK